MFTVFFHFILSRRSGFRYTVKKGLKGDAFSMSYPPSKGFFRERSGAGAKVVTVLLVLLLLFGLLGIFAIHTVASVFEQRGLQRVMESFLKSDEVREDVADVIRETFPDDLITNTQVDALINDDAIMEAAGRYIYDVLHFDQAGSEDFYDHILSALDDPASASLYNQALDRLTETLGIDDETYRNAIESIAEEQQIVLPEGETDKLALASAILHASIDQQRDQLPEISTNITVTTDRTMLLITGMQELIILFETPRFILYNLLALAIFYGILLLINRNYRKPFLHCSIPYFIISGMLFLANGLIPTLLSFVGKADSRLTIVTDIASGALQHSGILALCFAFSLLLVFILLTVVKRIRASRPDPAPAEAPATAGDAVAAPGAEHSSL